MTKKVPLSLAPSRYDKGIAGAGGKCNVRKRGSDERCKNSAGAGTEHLGFGACAWHGGNNPKMVTHARKQEINALAQELDIAPHDALLLCVRLSAGTVAWLRNQIDNCDPNVDTAALAPLMADYGTERDRLAKVSAMAIAAGIDERRVALEEEQGMLIAHAVRSILNDLHLTVDQRRLAPAIARRHLMALTAGEPAGLADPS